jgi:hypothetical protein
MINLRGAAIEWQRDVIQQVVGGASEMLGERSPDSGFTLVRKRPAPDSAQAEADSKRGEKSDDFHQAHDIISCAT